MPDPRAYGFGPFRLLPDRRQLLHGDGAVPLTPKAFDTLVALVERRARVVGKDELLRHLWPDVVVEESSLTQQIFLLRRALDDTSDGQRYIATVPRHGYRFVADVAEIPADGAPAGTFGAPSARQGRSRSIATGALIRRTWIGAALAVAIVAIGFFVVGPGRPGRLGRTPAIELTFSRLTAEPSLESFPSLAPDGRWFAYAVGPLDYPGEVDIYLRGVGLDNAIDLTPGSPGADTEPMFSPDGESIAFRSDRRGGGIFVMRRTGESVRRVCDAGFNPAWSPDGRHLAYATANTGASPAFRGVRSQVWTVDVASGERRMVVDGDARQPQWSPHGHRIAYWGSPTASYTEVAIYTVAAAGGKPTLAVAGAAASRVVYWNPVWSPDGRDLYFSSDRDGSMNLWRVRIDERSGDVLAAPEPVTTPSTFAAHASFSAAGDRMAFASMPANAAIHRVDFDPVEEEVVGPPVAITEGSGNWVWPEASPDGRWLAFHSGVAPQREDIYVSAADGSGRRQLTDDAFADRLARWSPDGRRIAFYSTRSGRWNIWVVDADGGGLRQVTAGSGPPVFFPVWSPDGGRLAGSDVTRSFIFDPAQPWNEKTLTALPPLEGRDGHFTPWSWSPDGTRLAGHVRGTGVWILSLKQGTYTRLTDFGSTPHWLSDGRRLLFAADSRVLLVDSASKRAKELLSFGSSRVQLAAGGGFSVSRDDRRIYVAPVVREGDIWMATFKR